MVKVTIFLIISIVGGYFVIDKLPFLAGYARYSNINIESNNYMFFLKLLMLFIFIYCRKGLFKDKTNIYFFMMFIVDIIFTGLGFISPVLKRINLYFGIYSIILLIKIINLGYDKYSKSWLNLFVILYILIYFFIIYFMLGQSHIFPYNFIQI